MSTSGSSEGTVSLQSCWNSKPEGEMNEKCYRVLEKRNRTFPERVQIGEGDTEKEGKANLWVLTTTEDKVWEWR